MTSSIEIKNKENSLVELMGRILKEPLSPLDRSLKKLSEDSSDIRDSILQVNDTLGALNYDADKDRKILKKIQESIPDLEAGIQTCILSNAEASSKKVVDTIDAISIRYEEKLKTASDVLLEKMVSQGRGLVDSTNEIISYFEMKFESVQALMLVMESEIQKSRNLSESSCAGLSEKIDENNSVIFNELKNDLAGLESSVLEKLNEVGAIIGGIEKEQKNFMSQLNQQNTLLTKEVALGKHRFAQLMIIMGLLGGMMFIYMGFNVLGGID